MKYLKNTQPRPSMWIYHALTFTHRPTHPYTLPLPVYSQGMQSMEDEVNGSDESNRAADHSGEIVEGGRERESSMGITHEFCHSGGGGV